MFQRFWVLALTVFWITMNVLLWRSEFGSNTELASRVPIEVVWARILTAPDDSTLEVTYKGAKMGYCRWVTNAGEELATGKVGNENVELEGRVKRLSTYTADLDGNFLFPAAGVRLRFEAHGRFDTNRAWTDVTGRVLLRPTTWEMRLSKAEGKLELQSLEDRKVTWQRQLSFSDLRNPSKLLPQLGAPLSPELLAAGSASTNLSFGLDWEAHHDSIRIGRTQVRIYRLRARLLDQHEVTVLVSRVGEILRVELPNGVKLVNDALAF